MEFFNPVHIVAGIDGAAYLTRFIEKQYSKLGMILLITRGMDFLQSDAYKLLKSILEPWKVREVSLTVSNPDVADMAALLEILSGESYEGIIAVGGGSVLDTAKTMALALLVGIRGIAALRKFVLRGQYEPVVPIPWIGIPTTSGTGSEVTSWATVWDKENECKMSCSCDKNFAVLAVIDPIFTVTCPLSLTISSALDAVCHSTESFWARHTNEISQEFALLAIRQIRGHLEDLAQHRQDDALRFLIGKASLYAGMAFSNTRTTVCHSVSYPLTEKFGIPHGVAAALTLGDFMEFNKAAIPRYDELLLAFQCHSAQEVKSWIFRMLGLGNFSTHLYDYRITQSDIPYLVRHSFTKGRTDNNPVAVQESDVDQLLRHLV
ncbi:phosphonoacetaldehyde reductase [Megasphaera cerevisiae]|uniref:phosphonoacetaldehyde reductase n=1 Tax=Megasphaera cerevisiae TaxID=39029 RepID=UPI00065AA2A1|nr:phosphonoacetaldehyde reductase [Megasphaera cerevisiae]OKY54097.1 hypothetical protein BSR42_03875 [Megasphaera cerevisiae]SJZ56134.1 Alcohol dehydrogenase, class IV [Megasphaera cerevisiae DSM 20462]